MPLYTFVNPHGHRIEWLTNADVTEFIRDGVKWTREPVQAFAVKKGVSEPGQREEVLAGYADAENRHGTRMRSRYSAKQIKKIWATP